MKIKLFILGLGLFFGLSPVFSLTGVESGTQYGTGEDSIRVLENLQIFTFYGKQNLFSEAISSWETVYKEAPAASSEIYRLGTRFIKWEIEQEKDAVKKQELFKKLMKLYDDRITYFGNDDKYPTSWILGNKVLDYVELASINPAYSNEEVYQWSKASVDGQGSDANGTVLFYFIDSSAKKLVKDQAHGMNFINEYLQVSNLLNEKIALKDKNQKTYSALKSSVDNIFVQSGVADCATLEKIFKENVEKNKTNFEELTKTINLFALAGCTESSLYFEASKYAHDIKPTSFSAVGLAEQAYKNKQYQEAVNYFNEAVSLDNSNEQKASHEQKMALIYYNNIGDFSKSRAHALKASEYNPSLADPYILIARMYAESGKTIYSDDPILQKTVYWAAVDVLQKAVNSGVDKAEDVKKLINIYKEAYPSSENVFFHPELQVGNPFTIGGWISVTVIVR